MLYDCTANCEDTAQLTVLCVAVCCSVLRFMAACFRVLQSVAVCCHVKISLNWLCYVTWSWFLRNPRLTMFDDYRDGFWEFVNWPCYMTVQQVAMTCLNWHWNIHRRRHRHRHKQRPSRRHRHRHKQRPSRRHRHRHGHRHSKLPRLVSIDYGVATISRLLRTTDLFCKRALQKRPIFRKRDLYFEGAY